MNLNFFKTIFISVHTNNSNFKFLTATIIIAVIVPSLTGRMFKDGMIYSTIAKNLAIGEGAFGICVKQ
jgi:hypothetical protein